MVKSHHGAATVSGELSSREATGLGRDCRAWKRDDPRTRWEGGRTRRSASQETQLTESRHTLRVKGRLSCRRFSHVYFSVGWLVSPQLVSSTPLPQRKANGANDLMSLRPPKCLSAPPRRKSPLSKLRALWRPLLASRCSNGRSRLWLRRFVWHRDWRSFKAAVLGRWGGGACGGGHPKKSSSLLN